MVCELISYRLHRNSDAEMQLRPQIIQSDIVDYKEKNFKNAWGDIATCFGTNSSCLSATGAGLT